MDKTKLIGKISNVAVDPEYAKRGIGYAMLIKHIETAPLKNIKSLYLEARVDTIGFYKKAGFAPEGPEFISERSGLPLQKMYLKL